MPSLQGVMDILLQPEINEHHSLCINLLNLATFNTDLVDALVQSPSEALMLLDIALLAAQQHVLQKHSLQAPAVVKELVHLRLEPLPFHMDQSASAWYPAIGAIRSCHIDRLLTLSGTVVRTGAVTVMESHKTFACSRCHNRC